MMRWHKFLSTILHPIVMPTVGLLLYFYLSPINISFKEQVFFLSIVFIATYIIPVLILIFLKLTNKITSLDLPLIKERKVPLFIMMCVFLILARYFSIFRNVQDLSYLFYGTLIGLIVIYLIFFTGVKTSLHLLSIGSAVGFFIVFQLIYNVSILPLLIILILLSGLLASSRLYLKAHTPKEVYLGFFLGILCQLFTYYLL
jgi:membrane-associated phospholipid phosphatase